MPEETNLGVSQELTELNQTLYEFRISSGRLEQMRLSPNSMGVVALIMRYELT